MVKLVALYKQPQDPATFDKHYLDVHKPLCEKIPGLVEIKTSKVFGGPTGKSPWYFMAELFFKDRDSFRSAVMSPESLATAKDIQNFAKDLADIFFVDEASSLVQR